MRTALGSILLDWKVRSTPQEKNRGRPRTPTPKQTQKNRRKKASKNTKKQQKAQTSGSSPTEAEQQPPEQTAKNKTKPKSEKKTTAQPNSQLPNRSRTPAVRPDAHTYILLSNTYSECSCRSNPAKTPSPTDRTTEVSSYYLVCCSFLPAVEGVTPVALRFAGLLFQSFLQSFLKG